MSNDNFYDSDEVDELIRQIMVSDEPLKPDSGIEIIDEESVI